VLTARYSEAASGEKRYTEEFGVAWYAAPTVEEP
jgi:hypothetical protein